MKNLITRLALALFLAAGLVSGLQAQGTKQWSQGDPTAEEQYALEVINRVRMDALGAGSLYGKQAINNPSSVLGYQVKALFARDSAGKAVYGVDALQVTIQTALNNYTANLGTSKLPAPRPPLALYPMFTDLAKQQEGQIPTLNASTIGTFWSPSAAGLPTTVTTPTLSVYLDTGTGPATGGSPTYNPAISGPNATGGTSTFKASSATPPPNYRTVNRGAMRFIANLYDSRVTLREAFVGNPSIISTLYRDYGLTSSSDGVTTTNGNTRMVGISMGATRSASPGVGSRILGYFATDNEAFSSSDLPFGDNTVFVTGVAYQDNDSDGDYTPGEGIAALRVTLSTGEWYAVTAGAGGYAIPVSRGVGTITVTCAGFDPVTVTVGTDNVKVDFIKPAAVQPKPTQVTVPASTGSTSLGNLSARGPASTGANALIVGFVIRGPASKTLLIRGIGPALTSFGVSGAIKEPRLTLYDSASKSLGSNMAWYALNSRENSTAISAAAAAVGAFALDQNSYDTAMVVTLPAGSYTASVAPSNDYALSGGTALIEVYDVSKTDGSQLINLSTRGNIGGGDQVIIVGFVVSGSGTKRLLVRGVGPTLANFGVTNALGDPIATLYNSAGTQLLQNDDWSVSSATDQIGTLSPTLGAFSLPANTKDAVILTSLAPGAYTTIISTTHAAGVGLVEVYDAN